MPTLSNVNTGESEANSPYIGFAANIIPEASSSRTGVSVRYVPDSKKQWFVFRASYSREVKASDELVERGEFTYLPMCYVKKNVGGKMRRVKTVLVPNILFAYVTKEMAAKYVSDTPSLSFLTYYYDHFHQVNGKNPPVVIPENEMFNFIKATCVESDHIRLVDDAQCRFKGNETVDVLDGPFAGVRGKVIRLAGQQRVAVTINGLCTVATAYIPTAFLKVVDAEL